MVFDKNGYLFFSVGERGNENENPQTLTNDLGKIHRIKDNGGIPADNPFVKNKNARPSIFCYGNRNPQGLAIHPQTGELWESTIDRIGRWVDFKGAYKTMDKEYMESVWWAFKTL